MKKLLILLLSALSLTAFSQDKQVAILEPIAMTKEVSTMHRSMVRGEMVKAISNQSGYAAFTRTDIDQIMREQNFQQSGMVDDATRKRLGAMQGVDYVCITKITREGNSFYLEANLVNIESGQISNPATQYGELDGGSLSNMLVACEKLAAELVKEQVEPVYTVVEKMPEFPGGVVDMFKFIRETLQYPVDAQELGVQGKVICQFVVNIDGSLSDIEVSRSSGFPSLDVEAVRIIKAMPKWLPGENRGEYVRVRFTAPITFRL